MGDTESEKLPGEGAVTVSDTVVVWVMPPPLAVTVNVRVPVAAVDATLIVSVDEPEPGAAIDAGLKLAVTPLGSPEMEREIAELNPPEMVVLIFEVPLWPCTMDTDVGEADTVKAGVEVEPLASAVINAGLGLPHPVTRSNPVTAE